MTPLRIFLSSVQKELATERIAVRDYLQGDTLLRRFFEVLLFEDMPAADQRADACYLIEIPDSPRSRTPKYRLTQKGRFSKNYTEP